MKSRILGGFLPPLSADRQIIGSFLIFSPFFIKKKGNPNWSKYSDSACFGEKLPTPEHDSY